MITRGLKYLLDNAALPAALAAAGAAIPLFGILLRIPIIGGAIRAGIQKLVDDLFEKGAAEAKIALIDYLDEKAKAAYAPQIEILRAAQAQETMTPEREADYAKKLDELIRLRPGVVNS